MQFQYYTIFGYLYFNILEIVVSIVVLLFANLGIQTYMLLLLFQPWFLIVTWVSLKTTKCQVIHRSYQYQTQSPLKVLGVWYKIYQVMFAPDFYYYGSYLKQLIFYNRLVKVFLKQHMYINRKRQLTIFYSVLLFLRLDIL